MNKIMIALCAVLIIAPCVRAHAAVAKMPSRDDDMVARMYMSLHGGATYMNFNYVYAGSTKTINDLMYQARTSAGVSFVGQARAAIEYGAYTRGKREQDYATGALDSTFDMQQLMLNIYLDAKKYHILQPFVGIGAGVAFTHTVREASDIDTRDTALSAMIEFGLAYPINDYFAIDSSLRYNYVNVASGLINTGIDVGIRIKF